MLLSDEKREDRRAARDLMVEGVAAVERACSDLHGAAFRPQVAQLLTDVMCWCDAAGFSFDELVDESSVSFDVLVSRANDLGFDS